MRKYILLVAVILLSNQSLFSQVPSYVPSNGLVGYWPFSGNANDASSNGNNGTVNGASLTTDRNGNANSAYSFNGNSGISIPHSTSLNIASSSTFSFWLKYNSLSNGFNLVFKKGIVGGCPNSGYYFAYDGIPGPAYKCFGYGVPGNCSGISDSSYLDNQWHNIVVVYNLQNSQIYFDGILQDGDANNNINQPIFNTSEPLVIGYYNGPYSGNSWNGLIDDIGIWNRALTAQEISSIYYQTTNTNCLPDYVPTNGLVGYWPFCGNANDASSNRNNGTVNGATLTIDRNGTANSAYSFDGVNDYIQVPVLNSINNANQISISAWINRTTNQIGTYFGHWSSTTQTTVPIGITQSINSNSKFGMGMIGGSEITSNASINLNTWQHLTLVYNGANATGSKLALYINGVFVEYLDDSTIPNTSGNISNNSFIGANSGYLNQIYQYFNGKIDDVGVWNRVLTAQEIANLYVSCNSPAAPTGALTQTFCATPAPTVASLTATGTGIQWYAAVTGGSALATTTALVNGTTYYASQTLNACESTTRLAVTVTLNDPQITASATTVCSGTPVTLSASTSATVAQNGNLPVNLQTGLVGYWPFNGNANDVSGNANNGTVNGATLTTDRFGNANSAYNFDGVSNVITVQDNNVLRQNVFSISSWVNGNDFNGFKQILSKNIGSLNNESINLVINNNSNWNLTAQIGGLGYYGTLIKSPNTISQQQWHNIIYVYNETLHTQELYLNGIRVANNSSVDLIQYDNKPLTFGAQLEFNVMQYFFNGKLDDIGFWNRSLSPAEITQLYTAVPPTYLWSTGETTATINPSPTATTTYWCDVTVNGVTCRKSETININTTPAPTGALTQTFCATPAPTIASLTATGTGIQWYAAATGGTPLVTTTALVNGTTYYASQTLNACESTTRLSVTVSLNDPQITASATTVCSGALVTLSASTTATVAQNCNLPANLQTGLVGYWPFCGNANDVSGGGNNGTVNGATLTTDRFGNANSAYSFDGVNDYIELPNQLYNGQSNSEYSISAWFNKSVQNDGILWAKSGFWKEVVLSINSNNQPGFFYAYPQPQGYFGIPNYSSVNLNSWNNITIVQKNSVLYTYVNNVLLGTSPANSLVDWSQDSGGCSTGNNFIGMGRYCQDSYYLPFNGKIDELTFWNRALTQEDIQQLNNGSSYLWSTGETTATINPTPTTTTTYWCDVTVNGVTCRKSVTITVNPNITPTFTQVAPICNGATLAALPTTSTNNITGTWSPAIDNTATTTYTFTPTAGQCATTATMTITVNPNITPVFTQVAPICNGATLAALSTTSTNNITGTWSPALNNTSTTTYAFTPTAGQCATTATMTITVNPNITPTFTLVAPICNGATLAALPTTSTNNITGTWSPALNNTATTTYTFTPTAGLCATTATMTITVNPNVAPVFTQVAPICNGGPLAALLTTSTNNITGTWSPVLDNTATTTYTFTPTAGQCATTATMTITVNPIITPAFTQVAAICSGADLSPLPTISTNGVNGTWSPALNYTATTTYTFTPISRQCATTTTMTITVNPNITPTFTQVAAICAGAPLAPLPTISNNGFTGTWSPAMNNTATTTYTFTPTAGQCATTTTMTVTVNPLPLPATGTITQTFCANIYPTLQNIVVNPTNVNWFSSLTSSTPLPITTNLPVGSTTYYASQFDAVTGCSSNGRLAVLATVLLENTPSTLTDQTFCSTDLKTLADLKTNGLNIVWYSSASGGTPLLGSYVLTSSQSLYAAIYNATTGCESPIRQMVQITIINCQLVANNLLTLNDNSLNDNLKIENIENFPINQIEIYNRFGELVWKTEYYNNDTNTFKGRANVSGVYQKDSDLPTGTYYFLLKYYDSYRGKYTDLKSFLYINNNN